MIPLQQTLIHEPPSVNQRSAKQQHVFEEMLFQSELDDSNFSTIETADLQLLFDLYDQVFFGGLIRQQLLHDQTPMSIRLSKRMTSAGGKTTMVHPYGARTNRGKSFEIAVSTTLLFESFQASKSLVVGVPCANRLQGLQRIFEHELVHLVEMMIWVHSSCARNRFRKIASQFFGHRESKHQLTTPREMAANRFDIRTGDTVSFQADGGAHVGYVNRITRRATVLVQDRRGELYTDGFKYRKFYVPIDRLRKCHA